MQPNRPPPHAEWALRARLRHAFAEWLRRKANRIDGHWSISIKLPATTRLSECEIHQAVVLGLQVIKRGLDDQIAHHDTEDMLRRERPALFP